MGLMLFLPAVVTLQENNAIVLVDLATGDILKSFSAGAIDLEGIDIVTDNVIDQADSQPARLREPDGVAWIDTTHFATANEGDLDGGSRSFTIFDTDGTVVYDSGSDLEDWAIRVGHYAESRSEKKGNEPESISYSVFGDDKVLFVSSERSNLVFVYDVGDVTAPVLRQVLPSGGAGPEGILGIPSRNLLIVANEIDARADLLRAGVSIFELQEAEAVYPTLWSAEDEETGKYIPFSALSGLAASGSTLFSVEDAYFKSSRMFVIDTETTPATVESEVRIMDSNDILLGALSEEEAAIMLNTDKTVNLDLEGIDLVGDEPAAGFWLVSEGAGSVDDEEEPVTTPNLLLRVTERGIIEEVVELPEEINAIQLKNGFEGVAVDGDNVLVIFQRAWVNETDVRLGIFNTETASWKFVMYPLDAPESQNGGWVGLSDAESLGEGVFLVVERDNQAGPDAAVKKIYTIDLGDFSLDEGTLIEKTLYRDLMPDLIAFNGPVVEKIESLAVDGKGNLWIMNDNDGVEDNSGEQLLMNLGPA
jgi:Esterase-like activity of phytase